MARRSERPRISGRAQLGIFGALGAVFLIAFLFLVPPKSALTDGEYVAMAKATPQGLLYFARYPARCDVYRVWTVLVSCDYLPPGATRPEKFRVHIDPRFNRIIEVESQFERSSQGL
jgi:hypothetical protein